MRITRESSGTGQLTTKSKTLVIRPAERVRRRLGQRRTAAKASQRQSKLNRGGETARIQRRHGRWTPTAAAAPICCAQPVLFLRDVANVSPPHPARGRIAVEDEAKTVWMLADLETGVVVRGTGSADAGPFLVGIVWIDASLSLVLGSGRGCDNPAWSRSCFFWGPARMEYVC
ncbi:hypothetical protein IMZ48_00330 [Candidatus Bathyarchaeota archaeon]|nr:hypothetical protein [Candidatus Bathyarchaeota archaeon]